MNDLNFKDVSSLSALNKEVFFFLKINTLHIKWVHVDVPSFQKSGSRVIDQVPLLFIVRRARNLSVSWSGVEKRLNS